MSETEETEDNIVIRESGEDYLEKILMIQQEKGSVRSVDLAAALNFSRPAVSRAVKILKADGLITVEKGGKLVLTEEGMKRASETLNRHRTLTSLFTKLGVPEDIAEKDACRIEHDLHEETFDKLSQLEKKI